MILLCVPYELGREFRLWGAKVNPPTKEMNLRMELEIHLSRVVTWDILKKGWNREAFSIVR